VDLGKSAEVGKVLVYNRSDCCQDRLNDFQVRVGDFKAADYRKNAKCGARTSALGGSATVSCSKQVGRYVSIDLEKAGAYMTLCEVKVFGTFVESGLAVGKPTKQSSTASGGYSKRAVDGNTEGNFAKDSCTATMKEDNPWWFVNLGKIAMVKKVAVYNRADCCGDKIRNFEVRVGDTEPSAATLSKNQKCGTLHWADAPVRGGGQQGVQCDIPGQYVSVSLPGKDRQLTLCEVKVYGAFTTEAYSQCKEKSADVALELETTKLQFNKAKKDIAAAGEKGADTSAIEADLAKVKAELEKAKKQAVSVAAKGGEALMKLKEMHKLEIAEANRGSAKLQSQLALSKAATNDMAKGKAAEAAKAAAQMQECTARQEKDAIAMEELRKGKSASEQKCVKEAKAAAEAHSTKYRKLEQAKKNADEEHQQRIASHTTAMSDLRKSCLAKENDAREEGRKAGLQACPGVNGLMREIWRLRQKLGKAAAGEEEEQ